MAIVREYMDGNCKVYIHDDYIVKTQKEVDQILENIKQIYLRGVMRREAEAAEAAEAVEAADTA